MFDRAIRQQDDVGLLGAFGRLLLDHRFDRDFAIGENARDIGQYAGAVLHAHAKVIAGLDVADRQNRRVGELVGLERQMRHAVLGVGRSWVPEREQRVLDGILSAPVPRDLLLVAKAGAIYAYLPALEVIALPTVMTFFLRDRGLAAPAESLPVEPPVPVEP